MLAHPLRSSVVRSRGVISLGNNFTSIHISSSFLFARHASKNMSSVSILPPECLKKRLVVPHRHMFGPGPSNVPPRIVQAGAQPVIGHMHPETFEVSQQVYDGIYRKNCPGYKVQVSETKKKRKKKQLLKLTIIRDE